LFLLWILQQNTTLLQKEAPVSSWVLFSLVGFLATWLGFLFKFRKWQFEENEFRAKQKENQAKVIRDVCKQYYEDTEEKRDRRIRDIATSEIALAFSKRSGSFVNAKEYEIDRRNFNERMERLEHSIDNNTKVVASFAEKLTTIVIRDQLTAEFRKKDKE
jgi:hypothetical protein